MTGTFALALMLALSTTTVEWQDAKTMTISATVNTGDPMEAFSQGEKAMKKAAKAACKEKDLGKPKKVSEAMVNAIAVTPEGQRQVTLSATYACG